MTARTRRPSPRERLDLRTAWERERHRATDPTIQHHYGCRGHGWLLEHGLDGVLSQLLGGGVYENDSFYRFSGLGADLAAPLLEVLPEGYLATERQNDGPTIGTVLRAVVAHPERLRAHGYVIGPGRCDERITVEGVLVHTDREYRLCPVYGPRVDDCECEELYRSLADDYGVDDALVHPHELDRYYHYEWLSDGNLGAPWYRAWWD